MKLGLFSYDDDDDDEDDDDDVLWTYGRTQGIAHGFPYMHPLTQHSALTQQHLATPS